MNMGKRIEAELLEREWDRSRLYDLVPSLEDGTLSALIKRDSKTSKFAPAIAAALNVELHWLITGDGPKFRSGLQLHHKTPPDPMLDDLAALAAISPDEAAVFKTEIESLCAQVNNAKAKLRAAANKARQKQLESDRRVDKPGDCSHIEARRTSY